MLNREIALLVIFSLIFNSHSMKLFLFIMEQRSHDIGGEDDIVIKQRLSSLLYVKKLVDHRLQKMGEGSDSDSIGTIFFVVSDKTAMYS